MNGCPSVDRLQAWLDGASPRTDHDALEAHLEGCTSCQRQVEVLTSDPATQHWHRLHDQAEEHESEPTDRFLNELAETIRHGLTADSPGSPPEPAAPAAFLPTVPGYELQGELGRGGMGVVYRAHHHGLNRLVALKMILTGKLAGTEESARFRREAETLAALRHPNILQVFDVGEAEGRLYVALELVEGPSLAEVIRGKPQPAPLAACMVETLARAVHHVHEHGILHRDLKPANILLQRGEGRGARDEGKELPDSPAPIVSASPLAPRPSPLIPKIADFGLAKRLDLAPEVTRSGQLMGTPSYMAPEQAKGAGQAISVAVDVHALGGILYECLTGRPPYQGESSVETVMQVIHEDPVPPSRLRRRLPRDLETICLKCLRKEPHRRYASAQDLADDLHRFLAGEPIQARPTPAWEQVWKWARRHPAVAILAATVLLCLAAALDLLWRAQQEWSRAEGERDHAVQAERLASERQDLAEKAQRQASDEAAIATAVRNFLQDDLLGQADLRNQAFVPGAAGRNPNISVGELLDRAAQKIEGKFTGNPLTEAAIRQTLGDSYWALGRYADSQVHLERAVSLRAAGLAADHPDTLESQASLTLLYWSQGKYAESEPFCKQLIDRCTAALGNKHLVTLKSRFVLVLLAEGQQKYDQAEPLCEQVLHDCMAALGPDHAYTQVCKQALARVYSYGGKQIRAEALYQEVIESSAAKLGADHPYTLYSKSGLASLYLRQGKLERAQPLLEEQVAVATAKLGAHHPDTFVAMLQLAALYTNQKKYDLAEPLLKELIAAGTDPKSLDLMRTLTAKADLARLYEAENKRALAAALWKEVATAPLASDHPQVLSAKNNLAVLYWRAGNLNESVPLFEEVLKRRQKSLGNDHVETFRTAFNLAVNYGDAGRLAEAEKLLDAWLPRCRTQLKLDHPITQFGLVSAASVLEKAGEPAQAELLLRELAAFWKQKTGADSPPYAGQLAMLGLNLLQQQKGTEAEAVLRESLKIRQQKEPDAWTTFNAESMLGGALLLQQKYAAAEPFLLHGYEGMKQPTARIPPSPPKRLIEALERLVRLADALGKPDEASRWRREMDALRE